MVDELKRTTKRTTKIEILKNYFDNDSEIMNLVKRTYNPFENFYISSVKTKIVGKKNISDCYSQINTLLTQLSKRQVTGNIAKELVIRLMNDLTSEGQKVFYNILNKDLKCGIGPESINTAHPGLIEQFSVQLANKYKEDKDYGVDFWYGSTKLDGIRCIYQSKYADGIYTREGSKLVGLDHILGDMETLIDRMKEHPEFGDDEKAYFIDGELFSNDTSFNDIQGIVLSNKNIDMAKKRKIYLKCFAIGPVKNTEDMVKFFDTKELFKGLAFVVPLDYFKVNNNPEEIMTKTRELVGQGYEGLMLRHPVIPYEWKRSNSLLKSKLLNETLAELTIVGYKPGKEGTKYENSLGAFLCKGTVVDPIFTDGKKKIGEFDVTCEVGTGFSDDERKEIWEDPEAYVGKEIIINYQNMSQNSSDGSYSLRFGIKKKGFKLDRTVEW